MTITEVLKSYLEAYPSISEFTGTVSTDFSNEEDSNYGLYLTGDTKIGGDILGNQKRAATFILFVVKQSMNDYDRENNNSFVLNIGYYMDDIVGTEVTATIKEIEYTGEIKDVVVANGMAYTISSDGQLITYQVQIRITYTLEMEEQE